MVLRPVAHSLPDPPERSQPTQPTQLTQPNHATQRWEKKVAVGISSSWGDSINNNKQKHTRNTHTHLDKDLHAAASQPQNQVQRRLLLNVVVCQRAPILQLLPCKDQSLLVWRDPLLVLDLRLHVVNRVRRLNLQRDRLPRQRLNTETAHRATKSKKSSTRVYTTAI